MLHHRPVNQSISSTTSNGHPIKATSAEPASASLGSLTKLTVPNTTTSTLNWGDQQFNTDELFTKHTISEIKVIQSRLRTDADTKKEELRQMVGERYRDLLQASSSIISIAQSSKRVVEALDESRAAIQRQVDPPLPKTTSVANIQDKHLHALQVLAAHMKLLLDAPEHLWRLIERKKFFPAAWLFLLTRVIHRALVRSDEQDEETWKTQGLDVLLEFPLIQRQWEVVSQFRSQIIHRATLWLRDASGSIEDTCAALVTLHLLDSRPLHDTLSSMFSQRSKTLNTALATKFHSAPSLMSASVSRQAGGGSIAFSLSHDTSTPPLVKPRIREVKESLHNALIIISQTMHVARRVFDGTSGRALIENVLEFIQSDAEKDINIPTELHLTTQALLMNVTSTAHFQLLPQSLQLYKPYIDLTSLSTSLRREQFLKQLNDWFLQSTKALRGAIQDWFKELETVKEVWSVRIASRKWINGASLAEEENIRVSDIADQICRERIVEIWTSTLEATSTTFETSLDISLHSIGSGEVDTGSSPIDFLFNAVALPALSQSPTGYDIPLRKYQRSLKQQLLGRTKLLDNVLDSLERCARLVHEEISLIRSGSRTEANSMAKPLEKLHEPTAERLLKSSLLALEKAVRRTQGDDDNSIRQLVFLEQITEELASHSAFVDQIGCGHRSKEAFANQLITLNHTVLDTWKQRTVSRVLKRSCPSLRVFPASISGPAPELLQALVALYEALQEMSFKWDAAKQMSIMQDTLKLFMEMWLSEGSGHENATGQDLALLREVIKSTDMKMETSGVLHDLENKLRQMDNSSTFERESVECIQRLQTFFPASIAVRPERGQSSSEGTDKFPNLLRYGQPSLELQASPDFAKPGPRFGLLLVGRDDTR